MRRWLILTALALTAVGAYFAFAADVTPPPPAAPALPPPGAVAPANPDDPACCDLPAPGPQGKFKDGPRREMRVVRTEAPFAPVFLMFIPIVMFICIAAVIIVAIGMAHAGRGSRYRLIEKALGEGKDVPPELLFNGHGRRDPLGGGLILVALGIGLSVALGVVAGPAQAVWGLIPLLIGVALLIAIPLRKRMKNGD